MPFPKSQRWLLAAATALALPAVIATWWMITPDVPQPEGDESEMTASGSDTASTDRPAQAETAHAAAPAESIGGTAQGKNDAGDFQQYAQSLRAQGQPEQTVRELVASRITAAYQTRRAALRNSARQPGTPAADLGVQMDALNREQGALIAQLVGAEEAPTMQIASTTQRAAQTVPENPVLVPAVLADALPATVKTEAQAADWEKLRNDFVKAIGGQNQDPADPNYRERWAQAQATADQQYRLLFGDSAYVAMQMKAQPTIVPQQQPQK